MAAHSKTTHYQYRASSAWKSEAPDGEDWVYCAEARKELGDIYAILLLER